MFENLVASQLNKYLGEFIENLNAEQLNVSIWKGDVNLKNLKVMLANSNLHHFTPIDPQKAGGGAVRVT